MVKFTIAWTKTASKQRREILKYWTLCNGSPKYSKKLIKIISDRTKIILRNLESFKTADYLETRVSAMGHFSIFYKIEDQNLIITAFWDNRQDPKKLLKLLITNKDRY